MAELVEQLRGTDAVMLIERHDQCYIVELENGTRWQIWPADIAVTLQWLPTTELQVVPIDDAFCSHTLVDKTDGSKVRVAKEGISWPVELVREALKSEVIDGVDDAWPHRPANAAR